MKPELKKNYSMKLNETYQMKHMPLVDIIFSES